jgi:hypothetical protein
MRLPVIFVVVACIATIAVSNVLADSSPEQVHVTLGGTPDALTFVWLTTDNSTSVVKVS